MSIIKKSTSALIVRVLGVISTMGISIIISRTFGAEGTGLLSLPNRVVSILSVIAMLGVNQIITKLIAVKRTQHRYQAVMKSALVPVSLTAIFLSVSLFSLSNYVAVNLLDEIKYAIPFKVLSIGLIFQVIARIYSAGLNGANLIWQSNLVNNTLSNLLTLSAFGAAWILCVDLDVILIAVFMVISRLVMLAVVGVYWTYVTRKQSIEVEDDFEINPKGLLSEARPLYTTAIIAILLENVFVLVLSGFSTVEELGIFSVCTRITLMSSLILQVMISSMSPVISRLYSENETVRLQKSLKKVSGTLLVIGLASILLILLFGKQILSIWGDEFTVGYSSLIVLSIGQLVNISAGLSGTLLVMTGFYKVRRNIAFITMVFSALVSMILIPFYGAMGAAYSFSLSIVFDNVLKVFYGRKKTGLKSYYYV